MTVEIPSPDRRPSSGATKKSPSRTNEDDNRIYLPAVYRYSCQGHFAASSLERGSPGHCHGVRSRMDHLLDMNPCTRADAITNFTGEGVDLEDEAAGAVGLIEDGRPNPALIYPLPPAVVAPVAASTVPPPLPVPLAPVSSTTTEEPTTKIIKETWTAFGSTEIECLQLTDLRTGKNEIVAVSPYNTALVSTRRIEMKDRTISSTEIGMGPYKMQFLIESGMMQDEENNNHSNLPDRTSSTQQYSTDGKDDTESNKDKHRGNKNRSKESPTNNNEIPDTAVIPSFENAQEFYKSSAAFLGKMRLFCGKITEHANANGQWLLGNLQDDFPARMTASAQRIVHQMPKTAALFTKVLKQMTGYDNDRDDR